ncbi:two-component sensor histidine kinase [Paenibacillus baekrokdamisoli]|uniref:Heme sensor protein HssS n=1 Tax=Paenibacillus baekrokdamisoli TaxID=1712516 RepID=A0A3G9JBX6_9BACL|nr:HAMP domain-containing sensor histidine kinase [Paenibacillus baekrokdamisoli]MBB3068518.1 signal transduction histidine kinase [Paenibacillus baekrokdamisoli]BBH22443.1 two-component sensor histidine kinase [Paenibacillus baekrokdamisoli]
MIKTLYARVILTFLAVIIFSLLTSTLIGLAVFKKEINEVGQNDMIAAGEEIIQLYEQTKPKDTDTYIKRMVKLSAYQIHLFNDAGEETFYGLEKNNIIQVPPKAIQKVLQGKYYRSIAKEEDAFIGIPFSFDGKQHAMFLQNSSQNENMINRMVLIVLLLALLIGSLCILIAARYLVNPLKVLKKATKRLAKGDFDVELKLKRTDEMGELAQSFNEMASELKQLEQMRQDFVSNVSHEIQTPLTSISGFAKALKYNNLVAEGDRVYYLDIIIAESGRLSRLGDNLLKLASLDSEHHPFEPVTFNLVEQIRQIVVTCEPQWSAKNIRIDLELPAAAKITADADLLNQIWMNIIGNSIKFTPDGGMIHIRMSHQSNEVEVSITDTGIGISPEELNPIFERFYKADKSRNRSNNGNGLGLAIVKKMVSLHHGSIQVKSTLGEGTTITVKLPIAPPVG